METESPILVPFFSSCAPCTPNYTTLTKLCLYHKHKLVHCIESALTMYIYSLPSMDSSQTVQVPSLLILIPPSPHLHNATNAYTMTVL